MERYEPQRIEQKWQRVWAEARAFNVPERLDGGRKTYVLEMLPYPSGELHMGHVRNYMLGEVVAHFRRRHGAQVLRPMGFDSFGLPAENAAIRAGGNPRDVTPRNIASIRAAMERLGWAIDWDRVLATHEPEYYRWTQWLFLRFFERGLAYRRNVPVKWCPQDQTVLANEQVVDGRCERCGALVESKNLEQWLFRITDYADQLLDEMELLESWPDRVLTMQRNWIGRSEGAEVVFRIVGLDGDLPVFTTRPDTLFGATFFVLAPEHPLIPDLVAGTEREQEVLDYASHAAARSTADREAKEKDGVFTGRYAVNPVNDEHIPDLGRRPTSSWSTARARSWPSLRTTSATRVRAVRLPMRSSSLLGESSRRRRRHEDERLVDSAQFSGLPAGEGKRAIVEWLAERGLGRATVSYRLRDWLLSRQRYWGAPIPIVYCDGCGIVPVPDEDLPVLLPRDRRLPAEGPLAARRGRGLGADDVPVVRRRGAPRDRHDGHVRRLVLVLPPLLRPATTTPRRSTASSSTTGCRSTSTSAASSTRSCTCSTRASSSR